MRDPNSKHNTRGSSSFENQFRALLSIGLVLVGILAYLIPSLSWAQALVAAVLPGSRSVEIGKPATAFATIINTENVTATTCSISPLTSVPAEFMYQATDPQTNAVTGSPNTAVSIPARSAQSFMFSFTPTAVFGPREVELRFDCVNTSPAPIFSGLNTLLLSASSGAVPDVIALAATPPEPPVTTGNGVVHIPGTQGTAGFSVATVNVGAQDTISVTADTASTRLPVSMAICETNASTGQCMNPSSPTTGPVVTTLGTNATKTFAIFVTANGAVSLNPARNRVYVRFRDSGGIIRGATSVAIKTPEIVITKECEDISGTWSVTETVNASCTGFGETETINESGTTTIVINQNGCNISYALPGFNVTRTGTVKGNNINLSGPFIQPLVGGVSFTQNRLTIEGTVVGNTINLRGTGMARGTVEGISFSCTGSSNARLSRLSFFKSFETSNEYVLADVHLNLHK